jgi:hypothetical protein
VWPARDTALHCSSDIDPFHAPCPVKQSLRQQQHSPEPFTGALRFTRSGNRLLLEKHRPLTPSLPHTTFTCKIRNLPSAVSHPTPDITFDPLSTSNHQLNHNVPRCHLQTPTRPQKRAPARTRSRPRAAYAATLRSVQLRQPIAPLLGLLSSPFKSDTQQTASSSGADVCADCGL